MNMNIIGNIFNINNFIAQNISYYNYCYTYIFAKIINLRIIQNINYILED